MVRTKIAGFENFALELDQFAEDLESIADEVDEAMDRGAGKTALQVEETAKRKAPEDTGELRADIASTRLEQGQWSIGSTKKYAEPTEYGSKPHLILPRDAQYLHFFWEKEGRWVKTDLVRHPGTPAQPFLRPALERHRSDLEDNIRDEIDDLIERYL